MRRCLLLLLTALSTLAVLAAPQVLHLKDYLGHQWTDELISYPLDAGLRDAPVLKVVDETGAVLPYQKAGNRLYLLVSLPADGEKTFTVTAEPSAAQPAMPARITFDGGSLILDSGVMALRLPAAAKAYVPAVDATGMSGPLQGVRQGGGGWIGRSWLQAPSRVTGQATSITARGPLFAEATVDYTFEGQKHYTFTARVIAGQPTAILDEKMDLNPLGKYRMLTYKDDVDASLWEWWAQDDTDHLGVETRHGHPANAVFSFADGLQPNTCRWRGSQASLPRKGLDANGKVWTAWGNHEIEAYAPLTYEFDEEFNRLTGWWVNSFPDYSQYFAILNDADATKPVISFSTGRPSRNQNPTLVPSPQPWVKMVTATNDIRICTTKSKDLQLVAPICLGSREWLLTVEPQSALFPKGDSRMPNAFMAIVKYSRYPLDKIKEWNFTWDEPKNAWPRLFCKAGDLAGMQARVGAASKAMQDHYGLSPIYRPGGTPAQEAQFATERLGGQIKEAFSGGGFQGVNWFRISLNTISMMPIWEAAMATPDIDPKTRAKIKAYGAFLAQRAWDDDYWPPKEANVGWGSINMGTLACTARVMAAMDMAGHPQFETWKARSKGYLLGNLQPLISEDGAGISCPSYLGASLEPILYMALALKYGGGYNAFKDDPRLQTFGQFMIDILTPPDPRSPMGSGYMGVPMGGKLDPHAQNRVNTWPLGHTSRTQTTGILDILSLGYAGENEPLAGALRTMCARMDNPAGGAFVPAAMLSNRTSPLAEPDLRSRWYPGYGVILRDQRPDETWFAYRQTQYAIDHFQADQGAFTLFGKGVPLMMDWGSMYSPSTDQAVYHNRIAWDVKEGALKPCPGNGTDGCFYKGMTYFKHDVEPWTCRSEFFGPGMSPNDALGMVQRFTTLPAGDFLQGQSDVKFLMVDPYLPDTPAAKTGDPNQMVHYDKVTPYSWQRRVLFAKSQQDGDPDYLLVRDDFVGPSPSPTVSYWVMANDLTTNGNQAHAVGQFGVDLDIYAAQPANPQWSTWKFEHQNWGGEKQLCARITQKEAKPFLVALYPHYPTEPVPEFITIANGDGVKMTLPTGTDYAFLAPAAVQFSEGKLAFNAPVGYVRILKDTSLIVLSTGGTATLNGLGITAPGAVSLRREGKRLTLAADGPAQTVVLTGVTTRKRATLDGARIAVSAKKGVVNLALPAGKHEIVLE